MSPPLFNQIMEEIVSLDLPGQATILSYADDLALLVRGRNKLEVAQRCLDMIVDKCKTLDLKLSKETSKAMVIRGRTPNQQLHIQGHRLEWIESYQ